MMRYLVTILLGAACLTFCGCATPEPPATPQRKPMSDNPPAAEVIESNDVSPPQSPAATPTVGQADEAMAPPKEGGEPTAALEEPAPAPVDETQTRADASPAEPSELPVQNVPDSNEPAPQEVGEPAAEPNEAVVSAEEMSVAPFLYDPYAEILATYVREDGLVNYGELRRRRLDVKAILAELDELDPNVYEGWSPPEKLAFWINAYNLKVLDIIARNYPVESSWWLRLTWPPSDIRHIKGIWTDYKFIVMDEEFTLAEVERRFFRSTFDDPRIWLALTYASQSSPPLWVQPYGGPLRSQISNLRSQISDFKGRSRPPARRAGPAVPGQSPRAPDQSPQQGRVPVGPVQAGLAGQGVRRSLRHRQEVQGA